MVGVKAAIDDFKRKKQRLEKHIESCKHYILNSMSLAEKKEISSTDKYLYKSGRSIIAPILERISFLCVCNGLPNNSIEPDVGAINVSNIRMVVLLPAPFCPKKPYTLP